MESCLIKNREQPDGKQTNEDVLLAQCEMATLALLQPPEDAKDGAYVFQIKVTNIEALISNCMKKDSFPICK